MCRSCQSHLPGHDDFFAIHTEQKTNLEQQKKANAKTEAAVKFLDAKTTSSVNGLEKQIHENRIYIYLNAHNLIFRRLPAEFELEYALKKLPAISNLKLEQINDVNKYNIPMRILNTEFKQFFQMSCSIVSQLIKKTIFAQLMKKLWLAFFVKSEKNSMKFQLTKEMYAEGLNCCGFNDHSVYSQILTLQFNL